MAMQVTRTLLWLRDTLENGEMRVRKRLQSIFADPARGPTITADLLDGRSTLPISIYLLLRDLVAAPHGFINSDVAI